MFSSSVVFSLGSSFFSFLFFSRFYVQSFKYKTSSALKKKNKRKKSFSQENIIATTWRRNLKTSQGSPCTIGFTWEISVLLRIIEKNLTRVKISWNMQLGILLIKHFFQSMQRRKKWVKKAWFRLQIMRKSIYQSLHFNFITFIHRWTIFFISKPFFILWSNIQSKMQHPSSQGTEGIVLQKDIDIFKSFYTLQYTRGG